MQNELKPISFYEGHPECGTSGTYVQEFEDAIFVPYEVQGLGDCSLCCLNEKKDVCLGAACTSCIRNDERGGYFILKPTGPAMATAGFSYGSSGVEVL